jgi:MSHA biogenesis protein MshE
LRCIPAELARKFRALPVAEFDSRITVVMSDPADLTALDGLYSALDREIELRVADRSQLDLFIEQFYGHDHAA